MKISKESRICRGVSLEFICEQMGSTENMAAVSDFAIYSLCVFIHLLPHPVVSTTPSFSFHCPAAALSLYLIMSPIFNHGSGSALMGRVRPGIDLQIVSGNRWACSECGC